MLTTTTREHFLSMEPLVGPVDIEDARTHYRPLSVSFMPTSRYEDSYRGACAGHKDDTGHVAPLSKAVDWIIVAGQSGRSR